MKYRQRLAALVVTGALAAACCAPALALLSPTSDFYVNDSANVLNSSTEQEIVEKNDYLYASSGAQIVVVTVEDTDGLGAAEYSYQLANEWGIGSAQANNGVLLLLSIGEQDYQCIQGSGLEDLLPTMTLSRILQEDLEPDFAAGNYDAGVQKTFETLYEEVCSIYGLDPNGQVSGAVPPVREESTGLLGLGVVALFLPLGALILVLVAFSLLRPVRRRSYPFYGRPPRRPYHRPGPPPPPPGSWGGPMFGNSIRRPPRSGGGFRMGGGGSFRSGGGFRGGGGGGFRGGGAGRGH